MPALKPAEVRAMSVDERANRLKELREDLMHERGVAAMGGSPPSPGKIRQIRAAIARLHTITRLEALSHPQSKRTEAVAGRTAPKAPPALAKPVPTKSSPSKKAPAKTSGAGTTEAKAAPPKASPTKKTGGSG